jgi:hypothetical protein
MTSKPRANPRGFFLVFDAGVSPAFSGPASAFDKLRQTLLLQSRWTDGVTLSLSKRDVTQACGRDAGFPIKAGDGARETRRVVPKCAGHR